MFQSLNDLRWKEDKTKQILVIVEKLIPKLRVGVVQEGLPSTFPLRNGVNEPTSIVGSTGLEEVEDGLSSTKKWPRSPPKKILFPLKYSEIFAYKKILEK